MNEFEVELNKFKKDLNLYREMIIWRTNEMIKHTKENGGTIKEFEEIFKVVGEVNLTEFIKKEGF